MEKASRITAVIVNHNGGKKVLRTIKSLKRQTLPVSILVVDNGSSDGSPDRIRKHFPDVLILPVETNTGYCHGANSGLFAVRTDYALLVDQDILCGKGMAAALYECALAHPDCYAVQARIMSEKEPGRVLSCGRQYSAFGRAYDQKSRKAKHVFAPAGAALYSMKALEEIGLFDERHFRGLHEVDLGYRALLLSGRSAVFEEKAVGRRQDLEESPSSEGYRKTLDAGNNLYLLYKNMPKGQQILNAPFLGGDPQGQGERPLSDRPLGLGRSDAERRDLRYQGDHGRGDGPGRLRSEIRGYLSPLSGRQDLFLSGPLRKRRQGPEKAGGSLPRSAQTGPGEEGRGKRLNKTLIF